MKVELQDLRHKLTEEGLERQKIAVEVTQVRIDFNDLSETHRHLISDLTTLNSEVNNKKARRVFRLKLCKF